MKLFITLVLWFVLCFAFCLGTDVLANTTDPSPRIEYLGLEKIDQPDIQGQPTRALFYKDRATGNEIECFAGTFRETLSCFPSGRTR